MRQLSKLTLDVLIDTVIWCLCRWWWFIVPLLTVVLLIILLSMCYCVRHKGSPVDALNDLRSGIWTVFYTTYNRRDKHRVLYATKYHSSSTRESSTQRLKILFNWIGPILGPIARVTFNGLCTSCYCELFLYRSRERAFFEAPVKTNFSADHRARAQQRKTFFLETIV